MITLYTHPDLQGFHAALDKAPKDWQLRLIMADWFEEQGDLATACALRWQSKNKKRPYVWAGGDIAECCHWYDIKEVGTAIDPMSNLPQPLFQLIDGYKDKFLGFATLTETATAKSTRAGARRRKPCGERGLIGGKASASWPSSLLVGSRV